MNELPLISMQIAHLVRVATFVMATLTWWKDKRETLKYNMLRSSFAQAVINARGLSLLLLLLHFSFCELLDSITTGQGENCKPKKIEMTPRQFPELDSTASFFRPEKS